jgi:hypothetical protein
MGKIQNLLFDTFHSTKYFHAHLYTLACHFCVMDNWRPDRKVGGNQTGFWGAIIFPSVSVKDRSLLVPLVMLNACLAFSWPNNVPFDREASGTFQAEINSDWQTGAEGGITRARRVRPRADWVLIPGSRETPGYYGP